MIQSSPNPNIREKAALELTHRSSACGKIILLGEHAVVYGFPAVAVPIPCLRARAEYAENPSPLRIEAPVIGLSAFLDDLGAENPLAFCVRRTVESLRLEMPTGRLTITSEIPVASGLGSGAAVSTAIVRVLASAAGRVLPPEEISAIVFDVERIYHGTPSGVDNTVIAHERPIYFRRGYQPEILAVGSSMHFLIADSGIRTETRNAVGGVRERWQADPTHYDDLFRQIGELAERGREHLVSGRPEPLGKTMDQCHELLCAIEVTAPALDRLVNAARQAGALGAKISGAGLGGNVIALVDPALLPAVETALFSSGATAVFQTRLES
jgi:mevalonate kinase